MLTLVRNPHAYIPPDPTAARRKKYQVLSPSKLEITRSVYAIRCHQAIKFGIAVKISNRLMGLQIGCPYELSVEATIPGGVILEQLLHKFLIPEHIRGEWFEFGPRVSDVIEFMKKADARGLLSYIGCEIDEFPKRTRERLALEMRCPDLLASKFA
jgi:hypothetical protein